MKKMIKKIAAAFMAMALVAVGMLAVNKAEVKAATVVNVTVQGDGVAEMAAEGNLNIYMWGGNVTPSWPGVAMTNNGDGTWTYSGIVCSSALGIIINNGSKQTTDITNVAVDKADITITIGSSKDGENKYNSNDVAYGSTDAPTADPDAGLTKKNVVVNVKYDGVTWDGANFHHWETGLQGTPGWPGVTMDEQSDGTYKTTIQVEESVTAIKGIVNYGGNQTADIEDIDVTTGNVYIVVKGTTIELIDVYTDGFPSTTPEEDPSNEDPSNEEPSNEDPSNEDPSNEDPSNEDPSNEDPSNEDPSNEDPSNEDPSNEDPSNEDPSNEDPSDDTPAAGSTWIIAGDSKDLFGAEWDAAKATNAMTDTDGDGVYTKTYSNVPAGLYSFKVTNGTWKEAYGDNGNNYQFKVDKACDVTITFDTKTKKVNATGTGLGEITFEVDKIVIAGTANICGEAYKENLDDNKMSATGKVYTKTYTGLAAGKYQIKFCANGAWTDNWGGKFEKSGVEAEAEYGAKDNISFETTYTQSTVTVELDLTNFDFSTKKGATFTITITDTTPESDKGDDTKEPSKEDDSEDTNTYYVAGAEGLCGVDWDPSKNQMVKNEDGTWSIKFTNVKAGKYEFKIATNGDWNNGEYNLEGDASNKGPNAVIEVKEDGSTVIITFDGTKAIITMNEVPAGGGEDTPAGDSSMVAIFAILAVLAAAGVVTVAVAKRRAIEE